MYRFIHSWICASFLGLLLTASPALAKVCTQIYELERLEARAGLLIEGLSPSDAAPSVQTTLDRLFAKTRALQATTFRDADLRDAAQTYVDSIETIRRLMNVRSIVGTAQLLTASEHRQILRRMVQISHDVCALEALSASATTGDSAEGQYDFSSLPAISFTVAISLMSVAVVATVGVAVFWLRLAALRKGGNTRYVCNYTVSVIAPDGTSQEMQMLDVSARGAKLRLNPGQVLNGVPKFKIGRRIVAAQIAWQNSHFVGLLFTRPISVKFVRKIGRGLAEHTDRSDPVPANGAAPAHP